MVCREVETARGESFILTKDEEKYVRALERLSKMNPGRVRLFANGKLSVRFIHSWHSDNIDSSVRVNISCEGGDGGDDL